MGARSANSDKAVNGRSGARVRASLRDKIMGGEFPCGDLLPSVRRLGEQYGVTRKTANRALKSLEGEGLIVAEPRRGYRVLPGACDPDRGCPVAFIDQAEDGTVEGIPTSKDLLNNFQAAAGGHGWSLLAVDAGGRPPAPILQQLATARACGAVLSAVSPEVAAAVRDSGMPVVVVDWWFEELEIDSVIQDNFQGGVLAARRLLQRGHRRIAWLGPTTATNHSLSRLGGATMELQRAGEGLAADLCFGCNRHTVAREARKLLSSPGRPLAVLAMWQGIALALVEAAHELGLRPGVDFEMVGWASEEGYRRSYRSAFNGGEIQPAVVWSPRQMADLALDRLASRKRSPELAVVRSSVPVWLELPEEQGQAPEVSE